MKRSKGPLSVGSGLSRGRLRASQISGSTVLEQSDALIVRVEQSVRASIADGLHSLYELSHNAIACKGSAKLHLYSHFIPVVVRQAFDL